ncbi:MAG: PEP-CTERM sorting domain-containing protein [Akkermansia sp.]|nr:PEP-CTERM sorting domain-containing protein [Akkermansia sp.]
MISVRKLFLLLLMFVGSFVHADELLVLYDNKQKLLENWNKNATTLNWDGEDITLTSWRLEFDLLVKMKGSDVILYTRNDPNYASKDTRLKIENDNSVYINIGGVVVDSNEPIFEFNKKVSVTLEFISSYDEFQQFKEGVFSVKFDDYYMSYVIEDENAASVAYLTSGTSTLNSTLNGIYNFSDIKLWKLDNQSVPEPSVTLCALISMIGVAWRRRRS